MNKFENIGVERQYESINKAEADRNFRISCNICCNRGMHLDCDHCAIAVAHEATVIAFEEVSK